MYYDNDIIRQHLGDQGFYYLRNGEAFFQKYQIHPLEIIQQHNRLVNIMLQNFENLLLGPNLLSHDLALKSITLNPAARPWQPAAHGTISMIQEKGLKGPSPETSPSTDEEA